MTQNASLESIFTEAVRIASLADRNEFLHDACGNDSELRGRVEALLQAHDEAGSFLDHPVARITRGEQVDEDTSRNLSETLSATAGLISLDFLEPCDHPNRIGKIGCYEVIDLVGRGGMGIVFRAVDPSLNRQIAIKVLSPALNANPTARQRFLREAQTAASVRHDHIVTIFAVDDASRPPLIAMELVEGQSLQQKIDQSGALPLSDLLRIGQQTADGLAAAHAQGLVHRDIKPSNILLEGESERVKITDFGLARGVDEVGLTHSGQITGTPQYMSPEQAEGKAVNHQTDLFSLGSVLYTMCAGVPPFQAESIVAMLRRVCDHDPRPLLEVNPGLPVWLVAIIDRLLVKDPAQRFQSAADLAELLGQCLAHVEQPSLVPPPQIVVRPVARPPVPTTQAKPGGRWTTVVSTFVVTSLVALLGFGAWHVWIRENDENKPFGSSDSGTGVNLELPFMRIQASDNGEVDMNVGGIRIKADSEGDVELKIPPIDFDIESLGKLLKSLNEGMQK